MEAELEENVVSEKKVCKPVINIEKKDSNEVKELREIVEKLQSRIDTLEREKKTQSINRIDMMDTRGIEEEEQVSIEVDLEEGVCTDHSDRPAIIAMRGDT